MYVCPTDLWVFGCVAGRHEEPNFAANEGLWRKRYKDEPWYTSDTAVGFAVPAGELAYSVTVFVVVASACLCLALNLSARVCLALPAFSATVAWVQRLLAQHPVLPV